MVFSSKRHEEAPMEEEETQPLEEEKEEDPKKVSNKRSRNDSQ